LLPIATYRATRPDGIENMGKFYTKQWNQFAPADFVVLCTISLCFCASQGGA
jgi:hypothetical protein